MKNKRSKTSYADLAKKVISKYKRRLGKDLDQFDAMSVAAMNRELEALMQRQEETRAKMLEADQVKMCHGGRLRKYGQGGGLPQMYNGGITPFNPNWYLEDLPLTYNDPLANNRSLVGNFFNNPPALGAGVIPTEATTVGTTRYPQTTTVRQPTKEGSWWADIPSEAKIGALAQGLGVVGSGIAGLFNKPKDLKYTPVAAPKYVPVSGEEATREARLAYQDAMRASRGLSPSRYYSQMGQLATGRTGATAKIAEQIANLNAQGMNQNAWQAAQLGLQNQRMQMMADQYNLERQDEYGNIIPGMISGLAGTVAGGAKDVLAYKLQEETIPWLSQANYESVRDSFGKRVRGVNAGNGLLFYRDSKNNPHWEYLGKEIGREEFIELGEKFRKKGSLSEAKPAKE